MRKILICGFLQIVALAQPAGRYPDPGDRHRRLLFITASVEVGSPEYLQRLIKFENAHEEFVRDLLGCPKHAIYADECDVHAGTINYPAFFRAAKLVDGIYPRQR